MKRWLQFILLLLTASAFAHAPEPKSVFPKDDANGNMLVRGKDVNSGESATSIAHDIVELAGKHWPKPAVPHRSSVPPKIPQPPQVRQRFPTRKG